MPSRPLARNQPESASGAPVSTVYVGFAGPEGAVEALKFSFPGDRTRVRLFAAQGALNYLRRRILALEAKQGLT